MFLHALDPYFTEFLLYVESAICFGGLLVFRPKLTASTRERRVQSSTPETAPTRGIRVSIWFGIVEI